MEYINVLSHADKFNRMLKLSDGVRKVPIIVEEDHVTIGFNGRS